jgi:hypothetical protein
MPLNYQEVSEPHKKRDTKATGKVSEPKVASKTGRRGRRPLNTETYIVSSE